MRLHVVKRDSCPLWKMLLLYVGAVAAALLLGAVLLLALGVNPMEYYSKMFTMGMVGNKIAYKAFENYLKVFVPLVLTAVGLSLAFKMRFWNIGAEGQVLMGALATAGCMIAWGDKLPLAALIPIMVVFAVGAGMVWTVIPAIFRARWGTNETLFTLMMNYVATQLVSFAITFWENPVGSNTVGIINSATSGGWLPSLFGQRYLLNIVVVVLLTLGMFVYLQYSKQGYEIAVVGESQNTARYIGIDVGRVIVRTMAISGAVCGLAGLMLVAGTDHTISTNTVGGQGFTAIMVSWLAKFNPVFMALTSFLLIFLERGSGEIATTFRLNESVSDILTGIILFFIIGCEFFVNYKVYIRLPRKEGSGNA